MKSPGAAIRASLKSSKPAFAKDGARSPPANAPSINDGAAALEYSLAKKPCKRRNLEAPSRESLATAQPHKRREWFTTAPAAAIAVALGKVGLSTGDIDLWEINEAFSCVPMACGKLAGLDPERVNVRGGAVALGHPIGASGARILTTLLHAMRDRNARRGLATLCIGGGEAVALVVEAV